MRSPKICFCALSAYPILSKKNTDFIGGAELQQVLIAEELVKNKYDVSFIVFDHGQKKVETHNGIKAYKTIPNNYPLFGFRSLFFAIKTIWKTFKDINADIYIQRVGGYFTGFVALFCLFNKKKFIYQVASDMDVDLNHVKKMNFFDKFFYVFGLKNANIIITQNNYQKQSLLTNYNKKSKIIRNVYRVDELLIDKEDPPVVIWVGAIKPKWKNPELFLEVARAIPDTKFQMIGSSTDSNFYAKITSEAEKIPNLELVGFVPYPEINKYFTNASILVNTSSVEGFPNTFLQAWAEFCSVVSLNVDPDEIICKYNLGFHSKSLSQLIADLKILLADRDLREHIGINGRKYVEDEHDIEKIIYIYRDIFNNL